VLLLSQFYLIVRVLNRSLQIAVPDFIYFAASCLMAIFLMAVLTVVVADIVIIISRIIPPLKPIFNIIAANPAKTGFVVIGLVLVQFCVGYYLAHSPKANYYALEMPVKQDFRIVQISDIHVTGYTSTKWLNNLVDKVNAEKPDLIFITGDIVDGSVQPYVDKNVKDIFARFNATYGVYGSMGNHDYHGESWQNTVDIFKESMNLLIDEAVEIDELGVTIAGRDDRSARRDRGHPRAELADVIAQVSGNYPVIVLDHQPNDLESPINAGVSLQFSGHTHNGQMFPGNLMVKRIFTNPWGLWQKGGFSLLVSCGVGTWGPSTRTVSRSEIVVMDIKKVLLDN
jgi:predicted MPP superfamily phosphohydrolase